MKFIVEASFPLEPFNTYVHFRVDISPEDLQSAGLDRYATA